MTRRKFTSKFKTKVVLEALKEQESTPELAQRFDISPQQINLWKREFKAGAESVFTGKTKSKKTQVEEEIEALYKSIGKLKVENDFLKNALR